MKYIEYDEAGIVVIRCMMCGTIVARRVGIEVPSRSDYTKKITALTMQWEAHRRRRRIHIGDKSQADLIICADCEHKPIDLEKMKQTIADGWADEMAHHGYDKKATDSVRTGARRLKLSEPLREGAATSPDNPDMIMEALAKKKEKA